MLIQLKAYSNWLPMSDQHVYQSAYQAGFNYNVLSRHWKGIQSISQYLFPLFIYKLDLIFWAGGGS